MKWLNIIKNLNIFKKKKANVPKQPMQQQDEEFPNKETLKFTLEVAKHVIQEGVSVNKSVACSPVSIDIVLSILAVGSKDSTLEQLLKLLGHANLEEVNEMAHKLSQVFKDSNDDDDGDDAPVISSVNALWFDQRFSLNDTFHKVLKDVHKAKAWAVDFVNEPNEMVNEANSWAEMETKGLIKQFLEREHINENTIMLLANALYFKGAWYNSFEPTSTYDDYFTLLDRAKVRVPFMNQYSKYFGYGSFEGYRVLRMPYKRGTSTKSFSMYIILPNEYNGLPNVLENINIRDDLFNLDSVLIGTLSIPKFNFESQIVLKESMKQLGLKLPFEDSCRDLAGIMDSKEPFHVNDIIQKCYVETNEQGTEAAAVTCMIEDQCCSNCESPLPSICFVAHHPFMFIVREDVSGALLFAGSVLNPELQT